MLWAIYPKKAIKEKERKEKERKGKERKGKERKGKKRKGKERKRKEKKGKRKEERNFKKIIRENWLFWVWTKFMGLDTSKLIKFRKFIF